MSLNRIQKLLLSEYCDFRDMVIIESPFAQTTREGNGIRQVHLGLTATKLVLATDKLQSAKESSVILFPGIDPETESFELIAVYPLECVTLTVYHRRKRNSLKARFCNNKILYFELAATYKKTVFWNLWCEKLSLLNGDPGSSHSETSVATSSTNSTLYLLSGRRVTTENGVRQLWCRFTSADHPSTVHRWNDRNLFLGSSLEDSPLNYIPGMLPPTPSQFLNRNRHPRYKLSLQSSATNTLAKEIDEQNKQLYQINRFGSGIQEGCSTGLFLPADNFIIPRRWSNGSQSNFSITSFLDFCEIAESSIRLWENYNINPRIQRQRHRRRYALAPQPHFLHGLGPWNVIPGARYTLQVKRAASEVSVRRQPIEPELRLPVSKRQLVASISCEALHLDNRLITSSNTIHAPKTPVVFFWTPDYWYRPRSAKDAYQELLKHLTNINDYHQEVTKKKEQKCGKRRLFRKKIKAEKEAIYTDSEDEIYSKRKRSKKGTNGFLGIFGSKTEELSEDKGMRNVPQETSLQYLRRILRMDIALTAWDFDSTTIANQLTLIDRELFMKIPATELGVLLWQQSSKNAPNIGAFLAFSHRIACLVTTEILKDDSEKIRARLVARFINAAEKCNRMCNFQSCRSLLCGLQSPPVYRLHTTWSYVRKRHATKYHTFEQLCRLYRDPRTVAYNKAFTKATANPAYLPFIGHLIAKLLDRLPNFESHVALKPAEKKQKSPEPEQVPCSCNVKPGTPGAKKPCIKPVNPNIIRKLLSALKIWPICDSSQVYAVVVKNTSPKKETKENKARKRNLTQLYKPLDVHEDNRIQRLNEAIELLQKYQKAALNYVIGTNELAKEYLLKARYREDRENFYNSFNVEPSAFNLECVMTTLYLSNKH